MGFMRSKPYAVTGEIPLNLSKKRALSMSPRLIDSKKGPVLRHDLSLTHEGIVHIKYSILAGLFARVAMIKGVFCLSSNSLMLTLSSYFKYSKLTQFPLTAA